MNSESYLFVANSDRRCRCGNPNITQQLLERVKLVNRTYKNRAQVALSTNDTCNAEPCVSHHPLGQSCSRKLIEEAFINFHVAF